jgi:hypothetical protein
MKNVLLLFLVAVFGLFSCNSKTDKNKISQKWEFDGEAYKKNLQKISAKNPNPEQITISETTINQSTEMMASMKLYLTEDGNAEVSLQGNTSKGKWDLVEEKDKKLFTLQETGTTDKKSYEVKELSTEKLILATGQENILLFFKPVAVK